MPRPARRSAATSIKHRSGQRRFGARLVEPLRQTGGIIVAARRAVPGGIGDAGLARPRRLDRHRHARREKSTASSSMSAGGATTDEGAPPHRRGLGQRFARRRAASRLIERAARPARRNRDRSAPDRRLGSISGSRSSGASTTGSAGSGSWCQLCLHEAQRTWRPAAGSRRPSPHIGCRKLGR